MGRFKRAAGWASAGHIRRSTIAKMRGPDLQWLAIAVFYCFLFLPAFWDL
jgi:hypothetical protein